MTATDAAPKGSASEKSRPSVGDAQTLRNPGATTARHCSALAGHYSTTSSVRTR
jgi:hypothetical protein